MFYVWLSTIFFVIADQILCSESLSGRRCLYFDTFGFGFLFTNRPPRSSSLSQSTYRRSLSLSQRTRIGLHIPPLRAPQPIEVCSFFTQPDIVNHVADPATATDSYDRGESSMFNGGYSSQPDRPLHIHYPQHLQRLGPPSECFSIPSSLRTDNVEFPKPNQYLQQDDPIWRPPTITSSTSPEPNLTAMREFETIWEYLGCFYTRARVLLTNRNSCANNINIISDAHKWHMHYTEIDRLEAEREQATKDLHQAFDRDHELAEAGQDNRTEEERLRWENISLESWMLPSS